MFLPGDRQIFYLNKNLYQFLITTFVTLSFTFTIYKPAGN
jgi:hypothetical protein